MIARDGLFGACSGDWFPSPAHVMRRAAILDMFSHEPGGRLLEIGCGAGRMLVDWSTLGHRGEAVDVDSTARSLAAQCVDEFKLDFAVGKTPQGEQFDYLVATEVLEHVEEPGELLKTWAAKVKPGGLALLTVPAFQRLWGKSDEWAGHVQRFEPGEFRQIVENAGLEVIDMRLYGFPLGNFIRHAGNVASAMKMKRRSAALSRDAATFASGHDRSVERKLAPLMRSWPGKMILTIACALQRRFPGRGHGIIILARKVPA